MHFSNINLEMCGAIDGYDFKQYVLGVLFYCFILDNYVIFLFGAHAVGYEVFDRLI